jgi:hypothetical protein
MEIPQANSLCSYLYLKQAKMSCFPFYLSSSKKLESDCAHGGGLTPVGGGAGWPGKRIGGWIQWKKWVHMYVNAKMISVETIPWIGGGGDKGEQ